MEEGAEIEEIAAEESKNPEASPQEPQIFAILGIDQEQEASWLKDKSGEYAETGERSFDNVRSFVTNFSNYLQQEKGLNPEQIQQTINAEVARIKDNVSLTYNTTPEVAIKIAEHGGIRPVVDFSPEEQVQLANTFDDAQAYIQRRGLIAEALHHEGLPDGPTISVALASPNELSEVGGGARSYGSAFLELDPSVAERTVFVLGDSMNQQIGEFRRLNNSHYSQNIQESAQKRELLFPHAVVTEALINLEYSLDNRQQWRKNGTYIEGLVYGGISADDIKAVRLPWDTAFPGENIEKGLGSEKYVQFSRRGGGNIKLSEAEARLKQAYGDKFISPQPAARAA